jgi:RNA polymerase sigma factor (sigma-70 family)
VFETTIWANLKDAGGRKTGAAQAFVMRYRPPLLAFLLQRGVGAEDAEDVVQEVFLRMFSRDTLAQADRAKGRFRSYLLGIATKVILERKRHAAALKRGGGKTRVSLDEIGHDPVDPRAASEFEECWESHMVQTALENVERDTPRQHELRALAAKGAGSPSAIAERLGRNVGQVRVDLHRARKRLAKHLRSEIALYCSTADEYQDELRAILSYVGEE